MSNTSTFVLPALAGLVITVVRGPAVDAVIVLEDDSTLVVAVVSGRVVARRAGGGGGGAGTGVVKTCANIFGPMFASLSSCSVKPPSHSIAASEKPACLRSRILYPAFLSRRTSKQVE